MRIFLDEVYDRKLKTLSFIVNKRREVSLAEIAEGTNLSKKTISMMIRQFEQELEVPEDQFRVLYLNKSIQSVYARNLDVVRISNNYLKKSHLYKMIRHLFLKGQIEVMEFCTLYFTSPSSFSRYRQKLVGILKKCGLGLSRTNEIIGEELRIRQFFFLFFSTASTVWLFEIKEYDELTLYFKGRMKNWEKMDTIKQNKFCLIMYICMVRIQQKQLMSNTLLPSLSEYHQTGFYVTLFFDYFHQKKKRAEMSAWDETCAALFFLYTERLAEEEGPFVFEEYQALYTEEHFQFVPSSHLFTAKIIATFFQGTVSTELYWAIRTESDRMHLILETCFIDAKLFYYIYDEENFFYADALERDIQRTIEKMVEELIAETATYRHFFERVEGYTNKEAILDYLYLVVYTLLLTHRTTDFPEVRIFIQHSKAFVAPLLAGKIKRMFRDRVEMITDPRAPYDLLVTDVRLDTKESQGKELFIATFSDRTDFSLLIEEIEKMIVANYDKKALIGTK